MMAQQKKIFGNFDIDSNISTKPKILFKYNENYEENLIKNITEFHL